MATPSKTTKIGKYDVIDIIGRGGMGVVYKARDPYLDRLVAIKMMNVDIHEDSDFMERFRREAKATASLQHPNIVTVYDLGEYENRPFLVMQYLEGYSLEALLRAHRDMTLVEKLNITIDVCQGLAYAHQRGIIHRDIKPGNIMVLNDGSVKIVDFGIARLGDNTLTRTGQIVGSLYYMPSEQLRDKPVDTRADIYSTGVVLYQLLTNALPFEGESTGSTLAKILSDDPPPFSQFALSYPPELEAITLRALAKDRDQRFPTAEAMAIALSEVQDRFKQDSIQEYLTQAEILQRNNELQQAQECLLRVLKLDRQHTNAAKQLSAVRAKLQAQLSAERVRQLKRQAEDAYSREEFDAALAFMKQAIELDNNPELETLRANIEKAKAEAELVRKAIARAEAAQRSGDLDSAKSAIDTAFSRRPNDSNIRLLRRAIERDLEERERQRQVEGLLDEARKQMGGRRFTAALDLLKEAQKLDPSAPQLRILLERLASEHQQEKQRRELERLNHEVQEAIDRDDYKAASEKAAEALAKFPNESGLARLKELADTQIEIAAQKEFVRNQTAAAQELLDSGQTQRALDTVEKALQRVPGNARLESLRALIQDRMLKERTEADKATCLRQANEAISLGRYPDAIQILESAQVRFVDSKDLDELLRFARDQQAKARRQAFVEDATRAAQRLLGEQDFEGAVKLLEKAVGQVPSEDLDLLLRQAREQRDGFLQDIQAAIAKGKSFLEKGEIGSAREFLGSRPVSYHQSIEFRDLLEEAQNTPIPVIHADSDGTEATRMFTRSGLEEAVVIQEHAPPVFAPVEEEPVAEEPPGPHEPKLPPPWKRRPLVIGGVAVALVLVGLIIWRLIPAPAKEAYLDIQSHPEAQVFVDDKPVGIVAPNGVFSAKVVPGSHVVRVEQRGYDTRSENISVNAGQRLPVPATLTPSGPTVGKLLVRSNVAGADVFIDRQLKDVTGPDNNLNVQLDPGTHRVQLKKSGYHDSAEQEISIAANEEKPIVLNLTKSEERPGFPADAYLIVQALRGAEVRVDGVLQGRVGSGGTLSVKVGPGKHQVQVNLEGYQVWSRSETVKVGDRKPVEVVMPPSLRPSPTVAFSATQETIQPGRSTKLSWTTQDATEVSIEPDLGSVPPSGTRDVSPSKTTTYTITARGIGGTKTSTVRVNIEQPVVSEPARIVSFAAADPTIQEGQETKLKWETQYATNVSISPGIGKVEASGEKALRPTKDTEYTLTAAGPGGSLDQRTVTIAVKKEPVIIPQQQPVTTDEDGIRQARAGWKKRYEQQENATFVEDNCPALSPIKGESADWTCHEKITYLVQGVKRTLTPSVTYHFKKNEGKWTIDGNPVFR